jgi:hypothetical protein
LRWTNALVVKYSYLVRCTACFGSLAGAWIMMPFLSRIAVSCWNGWSTISKRPHQAGDRKETFAMRSQPSDCRSKCSFRFTIQKGGTSALKRCPSWTSKSCLSSDPEIFPKQNCCWLQSQNQIPLAHSSGLDWIMEDPRNAKEKRNLFGIWEFRRTHRPILWGLFGTKEFRRKQISVSLGIKMVLTFQIGTWISMIVHLHPVANNTRYFRRHALSHFKLYLHANFVVLSTDILK